MVKKRHFKREVTDYFQASKVIGIKSGDEHRFIGLWPVVVNERVFVRSWEVHPGGWFNAFLRNPQGKIQYKDKEIRIRTRRITGTVINRKINDAYKEKFKTKGALKYVKDLCKKKSVNTTLEIIPR